MNHNFFYLHANISTSAKQKTLRYVGGLYKICMQTSGWKPHDEYVGVVRRACSWYSWSCTNEHLHILLEFYKMILSLVLNLSIARFPDYSLSLS